METARAQFKDYVNTLATIKQENGEKFLILKKKFYPEYYSSSSGYVDAITPSGYSNPSQYDSYSTGYSTDNNYNSSSYPSSDNYSNPSQYDSYSTGYSTDNNYNSSSYPSSDNYSSSSYSTNRKQPSSYYDPP